MAHVPPTRSLVPPLRHDEELFYDERDPEGIERRFFLTHPQGPRRDRRPTRRHHPAFTKKAHGGREWVIAMNQYYALLRESEGVAAKLQEEENAS